MFREDKNLYETVFNILPDAVLLIDKKGYLVSMNRRMAEWLKYTEDEVIGVHLLKLPALTTKTKIIIAKKFADRMAGKNSKPYEVDFRDKDGNIMTGLIRATVMRDKDKNITHDLVLITDTTKEKFLSAQIADAERKYKYLFNNLPYGFGYHKIIFNKDGNAVDYVFEEVNQQFERFTGLEAKKIIGKRISEVIPIKDEEFDWIKTYGQVAKDRVPVIFETKMKHFNKWYKVAAYSPEDGYVANIFSDITEEKSNEEEINSVTSNLADKIEELSRMNKMMEHREEKLAELKAKIAKQENN